MAIAGAGSIAPASVFAGSVKDSRTAGGIYHTKDALGRWSEKIAGHVPNIEVNKTNGKVVVKVVTAHGMNGYDHYIVKHVLLDKDYNFLMNIYLTLYKKVSRYQHIYWMGTLANYMP